MKFLKFLVVAGVSVALAACGQPSADELLAQGDENVRKGAVPEAILQYKMAIKEDPKRPDVRVKLSDALFSQNDFAGAIREAVIAADLLPGDITAQIRAGRLLLIAGAFEDARGRADKALALDDKSVEAIVLKGNALAGLREMEAALDEYQQALALQPEGAETIHSNIGAIQFVQGNRTEAEATFRQAVAVAPRSVPARLALASFYWGTNQPKETEAVLREALALDATNVAANRALGVFLMSNDRAVDAEPFFKAIAESSKAPGAMLALADYYLVLRRYDEARAILTRPSTDKDMAGAAAIRLAAIEIANRNAAGAMAIIRKARETVPKFQPVQVMEARLLLLDGKRDEALTVASNVLNEAPATPSAAEAHYLIGRIHAEQDRPDEAIKSYEQALRLNPQSMQTQLALAQQHLKLQNADKAALYARLALNRAPSHPIARALNIRAELMRGNTGVAEAELAKLRKEFPNTLAVMALVGAREMAASRLDAARATYEKVAAAYPQHLEALEVLGSIDLRQGRKKEAAERAEAALRLAAGSPTADLLLVSARIHIGAGNADRAEVLLRQAIEREPTRLNAYGMLGQLFAAQNRLVEAQAQFQTLLDRQPRSVSAGTMLAMIMEARNDRSAAEQQYKRTLAIDPSAAVAANNLAWLYVSTNRNLEEALQLAQTALKQVPEEPHVNDTIGWIYYRKADFRSAIRHLELSIKRDASDPTVHYHLGMSYAAAGERQKARETLERSLAISRDFDGADEARRTLSGLGGK